jgi:ribosome-binding protein aMBF1 (putative translation factor)
MAKRHFTTWDDELQNLGKEPDEDIAERMGITRQSVHQKRSDQNIAAFQPKRIADQRVDVKESEVEGYMKSIPLTTEQRQLITDRRMKRGWSQIDFAEKLKCAIATINRIEVGKAKPRPKMLTKICRLLNLEWDVDVTTMLRDKPRAKQRA